jgi:hypothetical protein
MLSSSPCCAASVRPGRSPAGLSARCAVARAASLRAKRTAVAARCAPRTVAMAAAGVTVKEVPTTKIDGQKTGTSGLRKKSKEFSTGNYLANWVQSLFNALPADQRVCAAGV